MTDDIKAIRDAMPTNPSFAGQWADWMETCSPERIARLLDALEQAQAALTAESERATQLAEKLQDALDFARELQDRDSE